MRGFSAKTCASMDAKYKEHWSTDEIKKLENFYYQNLITPLASRLNITVPNKWKEMGHLVDEILCALFHEMEVPF